MDHRPLQYSADEQREDRKFTALIVGSSFLISLAVVLLGQWITEDTNKTVQFLGNAVTFLGGVWIMGTALMGLFMGVRMRNLKKDGPYAEPEAEDK